MYSDEENYVRCRRKIELPTWIFTKDNFDITKLGEIKQAIELYLTDYNYLSANKDCNVGEKTQMYLLYF